MPEPTVGEQPEEDPQMPTPLASEELQSQPEESMATDLAKADLSGRLDVPVEEIATSSIEAVQWPDASLGCPLPGMMYAQVVTPGYRVTLETSGATYEYHTDRAQRVILCNEDGQPSLPPVPVNPGEIKDGKPWMPANQPGITE